MAASVAERASVLMVKIFKGDDTGGQLGKAFRIRVITEHDLGGCFVVVEYQRIAKRFDNVVAGQWLEIHYSHNETEQMLEGVFPMRVYAVDSSGKVRTITNKVNCKVTRDMAEVYGDGASDIEVELSQPVDWGEIVHKPLENRAIDISTDDGIVAAVKELVEALGGTANV